MAEIKERCSCGAMFEARDTILSYCELAVTKWRESHRHEPAPGHIVVVDPLKEMPHP